MDADRSSSTARIITVGSRCSQLALCQTQLVIDELQKRHSHLEFNILKIKTKGDKILDRALNKIEGKSLFTKELEVALDEQRVDFVVHSLKDLPTTLPPGLTVGAVLARHDPRDCVVLHPRHRAVSRLSALPAGSVLGTSSLRRSAQLLRNFPDLRSENIRGNLNTRLRKLDEGDKYDGIILAAAGIERLAWGDRVNMYLEKPEMLYAVSQGAMAVECRAADTDTISLLSSIHDVDTALRVTAERVFMKQLDGGCSVPLGTWSVLEAGELTLSGAVFSVDGREMLYSERSDTMSDIMIPYYSPAPYTPSPTPFTALFSHDQVDMIHSQGFGKSSDVSAVKTLLNNNTVIHRTGMCCKATDAWRYDIAENCGRQLAKCLIGKGAREVLARARAAGVVNVNEAPRPSSDNVNSEVNGDVNSDVNNDVNNGVNNVVKLNKSEPLESPTKKRKVCS